MKNATAISHGSNRWLESGNGVSAEDASLGLGTLMFLVRDCIRHRDCVRGSARGNEASIAGPGLGAVGVRLHGMRRGFSLAAQPGALSARPHRQFNSDMLNSTLGIPLPEASDSPLGSASERTPEEALITPPFSMGGAREAGILTTGPVEHLHTGALWSVSRRPPRSRFCRWSLLSRRGPQSSAGRRRHALNSTRRRPASSDYFLTSAGLAAAESQQHCCRSHRRNDQPLH